MVPGIGLGCRCLAFDAEEHDPAGSPVGVPPLRECAVATTSFWVGLDLGLRQTHVCIIDDAGATVHEDTCDTSVKGILGALPEHYRRGVSLVATEAGADIHVVRKLREAELPIAVFEARKSRRFLELRRNKTD